MIVHEEQEAGVSGFKVSAVRRDKLQLIKEYASQGKFDILLVFMFYRIAERRMKVPLSLNGLFVTAYRYGVYRKVNSVLKIMWIRCSIIWFKGIACLGAQSLGLTAPQPERCNYN